ncbi:MAG TPA: biotin/lipoyl-binding protein, partial [Deltaproteobacteria bacterium]|nr:biotin/lipoyl-binding protein [Deltaproteobacteria bacterium]
MADKDLGKLAIEKQEKQRKRRSRRFRVPPAALLVAAAAVVAVLLVWYALSRGVPVEVATVTRVYPAQVLTRLTASGYVVAQRRADVGTKVTGQLVSLLVEEGSVVEKGQVLARLENEEATAQVHEARSNLNLAEARLEEAGANLENARRDFRRMERLVESGAVSRSEYDTARTAYLA